VGAIIYTSNAKITFNIKGSREAFPFKNKTLSILAQKETVSGRSKSNTRTRPRPRTRANKRPRILRQYR